MPADDYKIVVKKYKTPIGQHVRQYNSLTIDEVVIVIVGEELDLHAKILHRKNDDIQWWSNDLVMWGIRLIF